jgi:hypothetical protein
VRPLSIKSTTGTARRRHGRMKRTLAGVAVTLCLWVTRGAAQTEPPFTVDPAMAKGPVAAPVTIVEFSDYQ